MYHSQEGRMPELVEHDGAASVSSKCPLYNIQTTLVLVQKNTFIFFVDNDSASMFLQ